MKSGQCQEISVGIEKARCPICERVVMLTRDRDGFGRPTAVRRFSPHAGGSRSFGRLCERSSEITETALVIES